MSLVCPSAQGAKVHMPRRRASTATFDFFRNLGNVVLLWSGDICALCQVTPGMFLAVLLFTGRKSSLIPQICHFLREKYWLAINKEMSLLWRKSKLLFQVPIINIQKRKYAGFLCQYSPKIKQQFCDCTFFSPTYTFPYGGKYTCLHANSGHKIWKSTLIFLSTKSKCRVWQETNIFPPFSSSQTSSSPIFNGKYAGFIRRKRTSKRLFPRRQ